MPLPSFAAAGATTFTFSRGPLWPSRRVISPRQRIGISNAGSTHVATLSIPEEQLILPFDGLSQADYDGLLSFLIEINWAGTAFIYTDTNSVEWLVRYVDSSLDAPETSPGRYEVVLTLKVELPWAGGGGDPEP